MYNFKRNKGKHLKKVPGPKLKNSRNHAYSTCCDYNRVVNISRNINTDVNRR